MNLTHYKPRIIEKRVETPEGVFLARFVVVSEANSFKLNLIEMIPLQAAEAISNTILQLEAPRVRQIYSEIKLVTTEIVSPFTKLLFFVSQPTRAPSCR